ncbi:MAG: hypothetical protein PUC65_10315 [Clostridiales bacterium]|nr:hypothetical protein [Clostridiales bacterium]
MQHTLVILHSEEEYAYSLMDYMNQHKSFAFKVVAFTEKELFFDYAKKHKIHVLLFDDSIHPKELDKFLGLSSYYLTDVLGMEEYEGKKAIFMYQSAETIISKINQYYVFEGNILPNVTGITKTKVFAICGIENQSKQLIYGLHMAQELSKSKKLLYLSFQPFLNGTFFENSMYDLSEAIYELKKEINNFSSKVVQWIKQYEGVDYLAGVEHYSDICDLTGDEAVKLLEEIIRMGTYDVILVDLPLTCGGATSILSQGEIIYELFSYDEVSQKMREEFHRQLELKEGTAILSHLVEVDNDSLNLI